jgi:hypothetical protein
MTNARLAILMALVAVTMVAAEPVSAEPTEPQEDCPAVAILLYDPYISIRPECLPPLPIP